jgi:hypothetical protein
MPKDISNNGLRRQRTLHSTEGTRRQSHRILVVVETSTDSNDARVSCHLEM